MTPSEKANQLVQRFYFSLPNNGSFTGLGNINQRWEEGKKCALIAVSVILDEFDHLAWHDDDYAEYKMKYWQQVKQEIENYDKKEREVTTDD